MLNLRKNQLLLISILANSFVLILFSIFIMKYFPGNENIDYIKHYHPIALNIVNGESYNYYDHSSCKECGVSFANIYSKRPPVFPLFIAFTIIVSDFINLNQYNFLIYSQYLLHLISATFIFLIYSRFSNSKLIPLSASIIYSSYPLSLYLLKQPNSEVIFNFFIVSFLLLFTLIIENKKYLYGFHLLFSGLILGLMILTRSISILLPLLICLYLLIFFRENIMKNISKILLGVLIIVSPWYLYTQSSESKKQTTINLEVQHSFNSSNISEERTGFLTTVLVYGLIWDAMPNRNKSLTSKYMSNNLKKFMDQTSKKYFEEGKLRTKTELLSYVIDESIRSPITILELGFWKLSRATFGTDTKRHEIKILILNSLFLFFLILLHFRGRHYFPGAINQRFLTLSYFILFYFILCSALFIPLVRYSSPGFLICVPLTALLLQRPKKY
jgi:4-amino-4-deoxy-L-arabinose transferase-like glycosyltransferase